MRRLAATPGEGHPLAARPTTAIVMSRNISMLISLLGLTCPYLVTSPTRALASGPASESLELQG